MVRKGFSNSHYTSWPSQLPEANDRAEQSQSSEDPRLSPPKLDASSYARPKRPGLLGSRRGRLGWSVGERSQARARKRRIRLVLVLVDVALRSAVAVRLVARSQGHRIHLCATELLRSRGRDEVNLREEGDLRTRRPSLHRQSEGLKGVQSRLLSVKVMNLALVRLERLFRAAAPGPRRRWRVHWHRRSSDSASPSSLSCRPLSSTRR